jgi:hypothetical protein
MGTENAAGGSDGVLELVACQEIAFSDDEKLL